MKLYQTNGPPIEDLLQEANLVLLQSLKSFRLNRRCKLITFAGWRIRSRVSQLQKEWIRESVVQQAEPTDDTELWTRLEDALDQLKEGDRCLIEEYYTSNLASLAAKHGVSTETIRRRLKVIHQRLRTIVS